MAACTFHDTDAQGRDRRLFEIVERAHAQRQKVVVYTVQEERASEIDRFLWIMKQEAFIPHRVFDSSTPEAAEKVAIVTRELNPIGGTILVADGHCSLGFALQFEKVEEFVDRSSPERQQACRDRYRAYQANGLAVEHLK
jgi:DNA polymerase-3 subunit chi